MGFILVMIVLVAAAGLFFLLKQAGLEYQIRLIPGLVGGLLVLLSFWLLPWVSINLVGVGRLIGTVVGMTGWSLPPEVAALIDNAETVLKLQSLLTDLTSISGWSLTTTIPTVGSSLRLVIYTTVGAGLFALVGDLLCFAQATLAKVIGLVQFILCTSTAIALFLSLNRINALGLDPKLVSIPFSMAGISLGMGAWIALLGMLSAAIGGLLMMSQSKATPYHQSKQKRRLHRSR